MLFFPRVALEWGAAFVPGPSNVPEISAFPVNRLLFGFRTSFSWPVLFLDLEQFLEACGLSGPDTANERKFAQFSVANINLRHFIARAEIEASGTDRAEQNNCEHRRHQWKVQVGVDPPGLVVWSLVGLQGFKGVCCWGYHPVALLILLCECGGKGGGNFLAGPSKTYPCLNQASTTTKTVGWRQRSLRHVTCPCSVGQKLGRCFECNHRESLYTERGRGRP